MQGPENNRQSGSGAVPTKFDADASDEVSQEAQKEGTLTESSDGSAISKPQTRVPTPSPAIEKVAGAGPAIAEHSKDAKAPKGGRQPGAYVKK
jgi:hypothetical protein